jgi:hypothetical protein
MNIPAARGKGGRTYCGPYSLAIINGWSCDEAVENVKRSLRRKRPVGGMSRWEVERVSRGKFSRHPLKFKKVPKGLTLQSLPDHLKPRRLYLVAVTAHYVVMNTSDWTVCDTHSKAWVPVKEHRCRLWRVEFAAEGPRLET